MLLFQPEHVEMILRGHKTQSRRPWKSRRAKAGSVQLATTKLYSREYFAMLYILSVRLERLGDISLADCIAEGYMSRDLYFDEYLKILRKKRPKAVLDLDQIVYVLNFEVVPNAEA